MVDDKETHDIPYYSAKMEAREDHGTAHVAILAENGDVVSATGSINEKYVQNVKSFIKQQFNNLSPNFPPPDAIKMLSRDI